jgi:hypothetical protein
MKTKEEIRTKWIRHTPLLKLDDCVDNAMEEYATQFQEDNKQILLNFIKWSNAVDEYGNKLDKVDIDNFLNKQD